MNKESLINEEINSDRTDVKHTFKEIRDAVEKATSREDLTELYKQSVYMILMTHSTPVDDKDRDMKRRQENTEKEFARTVHSINRQAKKIGVEPDFDENWKELATNGYRTEGKDLEAETNSGVGPK